MYNNYLFIHTIGQCIKKGESKFIKKINDFINNRNTAEYEIFNTFIQNLKNNEKQIYYSGLFHYNYSHGNIYRVKEIIYLMDKEEISYQRHFLKLSVLEWWYSEYVPYVNICNNHNNNNNNELENINSTQLQTEKYNSMNDSYKNIMLKIYEILDNHRCLEKTSKNAFQMIRDHIFYYKMGLFENPIEVMTGKCRKWFLKCNLDTLYMKELNKRIKYIQSDYEKYNKVYLGIYWDDIDYSDQNTFKNIFIIPKKLN